MSMLTNVSITLRSIVWIYFFGRISQTVNNTNDLKLNLQRRACANTHIKNTLTEPFRFIRRERNIRSVVRRFQKNDLDRVHVLLTFVLFVVRQRTMRYFNWSYRWFDSRLARSTERMSRISVFWFTFIFWPWANDEMIQARPPRTKTAVHTSMSISWTGIRTLNQDNLTQVDGDGQSDGWIVYIMDGFWRLTKWTEGVAGQMNESPSVEVWFKQCCSTDAPEIINGWSKMTVNGPKGLFILCGRNQFILT